MGMWGMLATYTGWGFASLSWVVTKQHSLFCKGFQAADKTTQVVSQICQNLATVTVSRGANKVSECLLHVKLCGWALYDRALYSSSGL